MKSKYNIRIGHTIYLPDCLTTNPVSKLTISSFFIFKSDQFWSKKIVNPSNPKKNFKLVLIFFKNFQIAKVIY